jgi:hypothetical protein
MVNQICIAGLVQGLSAGANFGMQAGLDMEKVINTVFMGAARSRQMENCAATLVKLERCSLAGHGTCRSIIYNATGTRRKALGYLGTDTSAHERLTL